MLYRIREGVSVFEDNPELFAIKEFGSLHSPDAEVKDRRMRFVILAADRRSPLRSLPEKEKREKAARIAGYKLEENRLDKNGRDAVAGKVESIEKAILKYKELQWDENQDTLDTINAQILEIKQFMKSDKSVPLTNKGKVVLDSEGEEIRVTDPKTLELAAKLGERLPGLIESKLKVEALLQIPQDFKPEVTTYSSLDIEETVNSEENLSTIDMFWQNQTKNEKND